MDVRIWGVVEDRLIEVCVSRHSDAGTLRLEGLSEDRVRPTADRVRAALLNSQLIAEMPGLEVRFRPVVTGPRTSELDLPVALGIMAKADRIPSLRWIVANGRLGLDGTVYADGIRETVTLLDVVEALPCQTPPLQSERMFADRHGRDE